MYRVTYEIDIDAESPLEAALETERVLKNMNYRPYLTVVNQQTGLVVDVDLEELEFSPEEFGE